MRNVYLLITAVALTSAGCSTVLVNSGQDLSKLTTRNEVHETFGSQTMAEPDMDQTTETFFTRRKIAEPDKNIYLAMGYATTLGLGELVWFPHQLYIAGRRSIVGQYLRFTYDGDGRVTSIHHDGEAVTGIASPRK